MTPSIGRLRPGSVVALGLACAGLAATPSAGTATHRLPRPPVTPIVFWSDSPWPSIWTVRSNGSRLRRILRNRQNAKRPRLSPDGRWVAFDGTPPPERPLSDFEIQLVRIDGTGLRTVTRSPDWNVDAQWSPDGAWVAFSRRPPEAIDEAGSSICVVRRDGSDLRCLGPGFGARWSPAGTEVVFSAPTGRSRGDIFVTAVQAGEPRLLLATRALEQPAGWSPNGKQILFTRFGDRGDTHVFVMRADGKHVRKLTSGIAAAWSPDGRRILYTRSSRLYAMNADGSRKRWIGGIVRAYEPDW
ncbi:MAG TPA: hypothetical protein VGU26_10230 [Gaiellaceae bacterium]|nr:hypothetical protein [Gaiellaceae bacterium]